MGVNSVNTINTINTNILQAGVLTVDWRGENESTTMFMVFAEVRISRKLLIHTLLADLYIF